MQKWEGGGQGTRRTRWRVPELTPIRLGLSASVCVFFYGRSVGRSARMGGRCLTHTGANGSRCCPVDVHAHTYIFTYVRAYIHTYDQVVASIETVSIVPTRQRLQSVTL